MEKTERVERKLLVKVGKETLIKAIIQSIPTYIMNCFKLPYALCEDIERMIARFYYGVTLKPRNCIGFTGTSYLNLNLMVDWIFIGYIFQQKPFSLCSFGGWSRRKKTWLLGWSRLDTFLTHPCWKWRNRLGQATIGLALFQQKTWLKMVQVGELETTILLRFWFDRWIPSNPILLD